MRRKRKGEIQGGRAVYEFGIAKLELDLIPLLGSSDGASQNTLASHFKFYVINRAPHWNYGSVIHSCLYLFYILWLPEFYLHKACTHTLITPGPLCTCINHHFFSSKEKCAICPSGDTARPNYIKQ